MDDDDDTEHECELRWRQPKKPNMDIARVEIPEPVSLPTAIWSDRERVMKSSGRNAGLLENHPEYTLLPFTPPGPPPKMVSPFHRGAGLLFLPSCPGGTESGGFTRQRDPIVEPEMDLHKRRSLSATLAHSHGGAVAS